MNTNTRPEHPNPQFRRDNWQNLNGEWDFGFSKKAKRRYKFSKNYDKAVALRKRENYNQTIIVPFCPESKLSGVGYTDFLNEVWYRRTVHLDEIEGRILLHIGAADYQTTVLVNGKPAGRHTGGYTSFSFEITEHLHKGDNEIFICCEDNNRAPLVMRGKQSEQKKSHGCDYTRTTGIWQTVWLEFVPESYIRTFYVYPDAENACVTVRAETVGKGEFCIEACLDGEIVGKASAAADGTVYVTLPLAKTALWEVGNGRLYDLTLRFGEDTVHSYFGLRSVKLDGMRFLLNGKSVFQRLVLDQGFYRDGIYTAPSDEALQKDIALSLAVGFNGARLHQKVFEPRFLYHCDQMGYLVWGEYGSWGFDHSDPKSVSVFLREWREALARDFNHPSIIGWCPMNETWNYAGRRQYDPLLETVYDFTKTADPTRPCIDTSGNFHVKTDIYDVHDYRDNAEAFKRDFDKLVTDGELYEEVLKNHPNRQKYGGQPVFVSEYGGIRWVSDKDVKSWGYGKDVKTPEEFSERYCGLTRALKNNRCMCGFCYTQLYDIEQEQNGLYTYDREKKFSDGIYKEILRANAEKAAIE